MEDNGLLHFREDSDKVTACAGRFSHLQRYLEPFGFGSEDIISLKHLQLLTALILMSSALANVSMW